MQELISVIIPVWNEKDRVVRAIESIQNQTWKNLEILVVDDGSTDGTQDVVKEIAAKDSRVRFLVAPADPDRFDTKLKRNINAGWSARNVGLAAAQGSYITFQDADDVSLLNRLQVQYELIEKYGADHITTNYAPWNEARIGTLYTGPLPSPTLGPKELFALSQKAKGLVPKLFSPLNRSIHFHYKRLRGLNKLFFGTLDSYPGAGNSPLFRATVIKKVQFRPLRTRVWPTFMGRGADRDFNFQVAETFKNSYYFDIPLYLWDNHQ